MFKKALSFVVLSSIASVASISYAGSAHAINITVIPGSSGPGGAQGAFSKNYSDPNYVTADFNNGIAPINYTFATPYSTTAYSQQTGIYADKWAPSNPNGSNNTSEYLAVFNDGGSTTTNADGSQTNKGSVFITANNGSMFNYFGFDAGALSTGNLIQFVNTTTKQTVASYSYSDLNKLAPVANAQQGGQLNGFFEFLSTGNNDNFNEIVLTQVDGSGGFESDNHTFHIGKGSYASSVPEPGVVLGLVGVGALFLRKRNSQKIA